MIKTKLFTVKPDRYGGKGLFAKHRITKGTIIGFECPDCQRYQTSFPDDIPRSARSLFYTHSYLNEKGTRHVIPCGPARYLNHGCNANILSTEQGFDIAVRDIPRGKEALVDYRQLCGRWKERTTMPCKCGDADCCKTIKWSVAPHKRLKLLWQLRILRAIRTWGQGE